MMGKVVAKCYSEVKRPGKVKPLQSSERGDKGKIYETKRKQIKKRTEENLMN
jgi:hypothetical protein